MNTTTKPEQNALVEQTAAQPASLALLTISPEKFAAEVFQPFKDQLTSAIDFVRTADYDITTTAGMAVAVKCRALFRDMRIAAEKERKAKKEPITKIGKLLDSSYGEVEARITPLEQLFEFDIDAEVKRKEAAKAEKERLEAERIDAIYAKIDEIRFTPGQALGMEVEALKTLIDEMTAREITTDEFSTLAAQAQVALDATMKELRKMLVGAEVAEENKRVAEATRIAEAARLAEQQAENARVAAEQARVAADQAAEAKRLADVAAAQQAAAEARQKEIDAAASAAQAEAQRIAAEQQAKIDAQMAALAEQQRALEARQAEADARDAAALAKKQADEAAAAQQLADEAQREADHGPALMMNAEFDVARDAALATEAERVRLQAIAEQAQVDAHQPAPTLDALLDDQVEDGVTDAEIIDMVMEVFNMVHAEAVDRLQAIDFDAARGEVL